MTALDQLQILDERIKKCWSELNHPYIITRQDEIDIRIAINDELNKHDKIVCQDASVCCECGFTERYCNCKTQ